MYAYKLTNPEEAIKNYPYISSSSLNRIFSNIWTSMRANDITAENINVYFVTSTATPINVSLLTGISADTSFMPVLPSLSTSFGTDTCAQYSIQDLRRLITSICPNKKCDTPLIFYMANEQGDEIKQFKPYIIYSVTSFMKFKDRENPNNRAEIMLHCNPLFSMDIDSFKIFADRIQFVTPIPAAHAIMPKSLKEFISILEFHKAEKQLEFMITLECPKNYKCSRLNVWYASHYTSLNGEGYDNTWEYFLKQMKELERMPTFKNKTLPDAHFPLFIATTTSDSCWFDVFVVGSVSETTHFTFINQTREFTVELISVPYGMYQARKEYDKLHSIALPSNT